MDAPVEAPDEQSATAPPSTDKKDERTLWGEPLRRLLLVALALLATSIAIVTPTALRVKGISLFDESTHLDYAYELVHGHVPERGSFISPAIVAEIACRGAARAPNRPLPDCGQPVAKPTKRTSANQNYNYSHPPLYYGITGVLARAGSVVWRGAHFISIARLLGIFWLFAGMLVTYLGLRKLSVGRLIAFCGAELLAFTPAIFYLDATVTNDAAAALAGGLTIVLIGRIFVDKKLDLVVPFVVSALIASTKVLSALPVLSLAALLFLLALRDRRSDTPYAKRMGLIGGSIVLGTAVVYFAWALIQGHRGDPNWQNPIKGISSKPFHGLPFNEWFSSTFTGTNLLSYGYLPPQLDNTPMEVFLRLLGPLAVGCAVAVVLMQRPFSSRWMVAGAGIVGTLTFPLVVEIQILFQFHQYFPHIVLRYGASLIPLFIASIALAADERRLNRTMVTLTAVAAAAALYTVYGPLNS